MTYTNSGRFCQLFFRPLAVLSSMAGGGVVLGGFSSSMSVTSFTARSSCGSRSRTSMLGSSHTGMSGLPFTIILLIMVYSLHKGLQQEYYHAAIIDKIRPDVQQFEVPFEEEEKSEGEKKKGKWYRSFKRNR